MPEDKTTQKLLDELKEIQSPKYRQQHESIGRYRPARWKIDPKGRNYSKAKAGWKKPPEMLEKPLEALAKVRHKTALHTLPKCMKPGGCGQPRVRGSDFCRHHGGGKIIASRRVSDPVWRPSAMRAANRWIKKTINEGEIPPELMANGLFREVMRFGYYETKPKINPQDPDLSKKHQGEWRIRRGQARQLAQRFVMAWAAIKTHNTWGPWFEAIKAAEAAGFKSSE